MKKKFQLLVLAIIAYSVLIFPSLNLYSVQAQETANQPGIKAAINNIQIQNSKVTGTLSLQNLSSLQYPQLFYGLALYTPGIAKNIGLDGAKNSTTTSKGLLVSYINQDFSLDNLASTEIPFELPYNPKFQAGNYSIIASIKTADGEVLGYTSSSLTLQTENSGFMIDPFSCQVVVNKTRFNTADGPLVRAGDEAFLECSVKNLSSEKVSTQVTPAIDSAVRFIIGNDQKNIQQSVGTTPIAFNPDQEKKIQFKIPSGEEPQVYEGFAYLLDNSKNRVSPSVPFRWIVSGASAHIESINLDKDTYKASQKITASVLAYASMDTYWRGRAANGGVSTSQADLSQGTDINGAKLKVSVTDQSGAICATSEVNLPDTSVDQSTWTPQTVEMTASKDCNYPVVKAEILLQDQPLAELTKQIPVLIAPDVERKQQSFAYLVGVAAGIFAVAILIGLIIFIRQKRKNKAITSTPPDSKTPPVSPPPTPIVTIVAIFLTLAVFQFGQTPVKAVESSSSAVIKIPINNPISSQNISIKRGFVQSGGADWEDNFSANFTNFVQVDPAGSSSITADSQCGGATLKLVGYSSGTFVCGNKKNGIRYIITIDGQPAQISNVTSPDSNVTINTAGSNSFDVWEFSGVRTADLNVTLPGGLPSGEHKIDVQVIALGLTDFNHDDNFYDVAYTSTQSLSNKADFPYIPQVHWDKLTPATFNNCDSQGQCYGTLSYKWTCDNGNRCNQNCLRDDQCAGATKDGCTVCLPSGTGGNTCQKPPVCGDTCTNASDCAKSADGCNACVPNASGSGSICAKPPACGVSCVRDGQCEGAKDGCTACVPGSTGSGNVCSKPPACGVSCERDAQCAGAVKDGCTVCAPDDSGKKICQTPFDEGACKCDGFNALNLQNPTNSNFQFEAFGKVEGANVSSAQVKSIQFQMTKSTKSSPNAGTVIATSDILTPQIVSNTSSKVRYRSTWSVTPPAFDPNGVYRVFSTIKCARKSATPSASLGAVLGQPIYNSDNNQIAEKELNYTPAKLVQNDQNLQLGTLEDGYFTKITETDSCRFIRFEYGQY